MSLQVKEAVQITLASQLGLKSGIIKSLSVTIWRPPDLPDQNGNSPAYRIQGLQFKEKYLDLLSSVH